MATNHLKINTDQINSIHFRAIDSRPCSPCRFYQSIDDGPEGGGGEDRADDDNSRGGQPQEFYFIKFPSSSQNQKKKKKQRIMSMFGYPLIMSHTDFYYSFHSFSPVSQSESDVGSQVSRVFLYLYHHRVCRRRQRVEPVDRFFSCAAAATSTEQNIC